MTLRNVTNIPSAGTIGISALLQRGTAYLKENGIPSPRLEAERLLCGLLDCRRIDLYLHPDKPVLPQVEDQLWRRLRRRGGHEPLQYITGEVEFSGLSLVVRRGVFIPRPETELILEAVDKITPPPHRLLDLCTGSGALAVALAKRLPFAEITATDCSEIALATARLNIERHRCAAQVTLLSGDLFEAVQSQRTWGETGADFTGYDLIVCNPPYISEEDRPILQPEVRDYEPGIALFAPEGGTAFYRRIVREAPPFLAPGGTLLFELGDGQAAWFEDFLRRETQFESTLVRDLAGMDRVAICSRRS
ncbi:MAG: peptide chain release factor N(5)-glutamine methyltransferase [Nitrospiria bacterium]